MQANTYRPSRRFISVMTTLIFIFSLTISYGDIDSETVQNEYGETSVNALRQTAPLLQDIYRNAKYGFQFDYSGYQINTANETVKTSFRDAQTTIDIYYEDFNNTVHHAAGYINYSNQSIVDNPFIDVFIDDRRKHSGYDCRVLSWYRAPLKHLKTRENFLATVDIVKNEREVISLFIKSEREIHIDDILKRLSIIEKDPLAELQYKTVQAVVNNHWSRDTADFYLDQFAAAEQTDWGIFEPASKWNMVPLELLESRMETTFKYLLEYYDLSLNVSEAHLNDVYDQGRILEFTYQTSRNLAYQPDIIYQLLNGELDQNIEKLAETLRAIKGPVLFRFNNEMNGDWCIYNSLHYQRDSELFVAAWRYVHDKIVESGADNVIFVWNPNEKSFPGFKWNHYMNYFPGERYVDLIGVTGYNTGDYYPGESWRSFKEIYDPLMADYQRRFIGYNFYITEFGSSTYGGDRAVWLEQALNALEDYNFKLAIYWNGTDYDAAKKPARIYRIDNDETIISLFKQYFKERQAP